MRLLAISILVCCAFPTVFPQANGKTPTKTHGTPEPRQGFHPHKPVVPAGAVKVLNDSELQHTQMEITQLEALQNDPNFAKESIQATLKAILRDKTCQVNTTLFVKLLATKGLDAPTQQQLIQEFDRNCRNSSNLPAVAAVPVVLPCELDQAVPVRSGSRVPYNPPNSPAQTEVDEYSVTKVTSINNTGNQVVGPRSIRVAYINPLRFDVGLGSATTLQSGPQLPTQLVPALSSLPAASTVPKAVIGQGPAAQQQAKAAPTDIGSLWQGLFTCYGTFDTSVRNVDATINGAITATNSTTSQFTAVLNKYSSKLLSDGDLSAIRPAVDDETVFGDYYHFEWPMGTIGTLSQALGSFSNRFVAFSQTSGYADWIKDPGNKQNYDYVQVGITSMQQHLASLGPNSDPANKLGTAQQTVEMWRKRFNTVQSMTDLDFKPGFDVDCATWFGKSKTVVVKLVTRDILAQNASQESADLITVVCNSRLTVSTGIGFSLSGDKTPAFVPGKDSTGAIVQQLGFSSNSSVAPIYAFQINGSLWAPQSNNVEVHATLGAALSTANSTGTVGFLLGPSLSFLRRTFFVTPAFYLVQRTEFLPGFKAGDPQGTLTSPPTQLQWKPSFATTLTFPINP